MTGSPGFQLESAFVSKKEIFGSERIGWLEGVMVGPAIMSSPATKTAPPSLARTTVSTPGSNIPLALLSTKPIGQFRLEMFTQASTPVSAFASPDPPGGAVPAEIGSSGYEL